MLREIALLASAIGLSQPSMPEALRVQYATILQAEAARAHMDPLAVVALVHHESRWVASAISPDGEDYGLGALRARFETACHQDEDPTEEPSPACARAQAQLLNGTYNLRRMFGAIIQWKTLCKTRTGTTPRLEQWLQGYGGLSDPDQGIWCGLKKVKGKWRAVPTHRKVKEILRYYQQLRKLRSPRRGGRGATTARSRRKT